MIETPFDPRWDQIVNALNGTCDTLDGVLDSHGYEDLRDFMPFLEYLDDQIFCCESCGWWSPISEVSDDGEICLSCEE